MIPDINQLSPAEMLFLQKPNQLNGRKMMRLTLLDLIMKGVLEFNSLEYSPGKWVYHLTPGQYFQQYPPLLHEEPFLLPFRSGESSVELTLLINTVAQQAQSYYGFQYNYVRKTPKMSSLMPKNFWNAFHSFPLTTEGKELRKDLNQRLKQGNEIVVNSMGNGQKRLLELPVLLGSGLLLIDSLEKILQGKTFSEDWIQELTSAYTPLKQLFQSPAGADAVMVGGSGCGAFFGVSDSFGGCGGGGCSGSGCSGGSGGSGCSGGGGCGGGGCGGGGCGGG